MGQFPNGEYYSSPFGAGPGSAPYPNSGGGVEIFFSCLAVFAILTVVSGAFGQTQTTVGEQFTYPELSLYEQYATELDCQTEQFVKITSVIHGDGEASQKIASALSAAPNARYTRANRSCIEVYDEWLSPEPYLTYIVYEGPFPEFSTANRKCSAGAYLSLVDTTAQLPVACEDYASREDSGLR